MAIWEDIADLVNIGAYAAGTNAEYDLAIRARPWIEEFLQQPIECAADFAASRQAMLDLADRCREAEKSPPRMAAGEPRRAAERAGAA